MIANAGLIVIVIGWMIQFFVISKKNLKMSPYFAISYVCGVMLLVLDGAVNGMWNLVALNLLCATAALATYSKLKR